MQPSKSYAGFWEAIDKEKPVYPYWLLLEDTFFTCSLDCARRFELVFVRCFGNTYAGFRQEVKRDEFQRVSGGVTWRPYAEH